MIRNGVIDAQREFSERRYMAESTRNFEVIWQEIKQKYGDRIPDFMRDNLLKTYTDAGQKIFALCGDILVNTYQTPPFICEYAATQSKGGE